MSGPLDRGAEADELFSRALEIAENERSEFLSEACGDDTELRDAVERLLRASAESNGLLKTGGALRYAAIHGLGRNEAESGRRRAPVLIGQTVLHYRIRDQLGAGGMGEVYSAEDTKLDRMVALKVLPPEVATDADALKRFHREAKAVAALNHPNIVTLHSIEEADGVHFLTMELVEGETLEALIPTGGLPTKRILEIALPLADALAAVHEREIIHRDLKPANIMIGADGETKVLDFGLAKLHPVLFGRSQEATLTALTERGAVVGTIPYMSPEQVAGKPVGRRTDIFSLGVILYEMCTGQRPFSGETSTHTMSAILRDSPPLVGELRDDLPKALGNIVHRCLQKEPGKRPQRARAVRDELEDLRRQVESERVESRMATGRPLPAGKRWLALAAVVGVLIAVGLLMFLPGAEESEQRLGKAPVSTVPARKMIAVLPFENLGPPEDEYFAAGMTEEITSRLAAVSGLGVISRNSADQYGATDKPTRQIGEELGVAYLLGGTIQWARPTDNPGARLRITPRLISVEDDTRLWSVAFDRPYEDIFAMQSEIARQVVAQLGVTLLGPEHQALEARPTDNLEAWTLLLRGRVPTQRDCGKQLERIADLERAVELDPTLAEAWATLSRRHSYMYYVCFDPTEARRTQARRALDRALQLSRTFDTIEAAAAFAMHVEKDYAGALAWIDSVGEKVGQSALLLARKAAILRRQGRWEEAIGYYERAQELDPRSVGLSHALAISHTWLRQPARAVASYDRGISLGTYRIDDWVGKAEVFWMWRGDTQAARAVLEAVPPSVVDDGALRWAWFWQEIYESRPQAALDGLSDAPGDWIRNTLHRWPTSLYAAHAHQFRSEPDRAREFYEAAHELLLAEITRVPDDTGIRRALSIANAGLGRREEAIADAKRVVEEWPIDEHPFFGAVPLENLALVYTMVGEHDLALDLLERLLSIPSLTTIPILELDPRWAPLREHPKYRELKDRIGEPGSVATGAPFMKH